MPAPPIGAKAMRNLTVAMAVLTLLVGVGFIITGVYVRRGSAVAITAGLIMSGGLALLLALFVLAMIVAAFASPMLGGIACVLVLPLGISIWLVAWLISAARSNANVAAARQQYQAQFYAYQQQQQAYGQAAYGQPAYGAPAAPAPPGYGYGYAPPPPPSFEPPPGQPPAQQQQSPPQSSSPPGTLPAGDADGPPAPPAAG
jgi:hypothetical protein